MGDNTDNQLGISQRGKSEDPVLRLIAPTRIHLSAHTKAAKPVQVSCGASHTSAVTGQLYAMRGGRGGGGGGQGIENMYHLNLEPVHTIPVKSGNSGFVISYQTSGDDLHLFSTSILIRFLLICTSFVDRTRGIVCVVCLLSRLANYKDPCKRCVLAQPAPYISFMVAYAILFAVTPYQAFCRFSVTETGEVFIWGKGRAGRLGHGDTRDR